MPTKSDQIRNLVKALGGKPRNSTIEDAIEDLVDLFTEKREVEMVEVVPERTLTSDFDAEWKEYREDYLNFELKVGAKYTVIINGETLTGECFAHKDSSDSPTLMWGEHKADKFVEVNTWDQNTTSIRWGASYGSPITLQIIEEQETVTPPVVALPRVEKKMVEIVPEQSVTTIAGELTPAPFGSFRFDGDLVVGNVYTVIFDDVQYTISCFDDIFEGTSYPTLGDEPNNMFENYPFYVSVDNIGNVWKSLTVMTPNEGEHTLAIYEEQEVVTPIDPKFVGTVFYQQDEDDNYLYKNAGFTEKVTKAELDKVSNGLVKVYFDNKMITVQNIEDCGDYSRVMFAVWESANNYYWKFLNTAEYETEIG